MANRTGTTATPFQFGGGLGYYQNDSYRTHVRARNFYVNLGKWSSQDPIGFNGRDYNLYRYARNNPVRWSDPSGLVVDSYKKVTDIDGFLSKGENARFLYTCRCGWIDKSHVATAFKATARMYQYYKDDFRYNGVYGRLIRAGRSVTVVEAAGPEFLGWDDVYISFKNLATVPPYAFRDLSAYISYGLSWEVEKLEYSYGIGEIPGFLHTIWESAWSYEDPPSNWLGVMAFWRSVPSDTWDTAVRRLLEKCDPMSIEQGQRLYNAMESYANVPSEYHRDDSFKNYPAYNANPFLTLPDKDLFHTWVKGGPYDDCCGVKATFPATLPSILKTPSNIYTGTTAHIYVGQIPIDIFDFPFRIP